MVLHMLVLRITCLLTSDLEARNSCTAISRSSKDCQLHLLFYWPPKGQWHSELHHQVANAAHARYNHTAPISHMCCGCRLPLPSLCRPLVHSGSACAAHTSHSLRCTAALACGCCKRPQPASGLSPAPHPAPSEVRQLRAQPCAAERSGQGGASGARGLQPAFVWAVRVKH